MAQAVSVREVMTSEFIGITEGETVADVAELLLEHHEDAAVVIRGGKPIGIVLARDLLMVLSDGSATDSIEGYMRDDIESIDQDVTFEHAANRLVTSDAERLVVVDLEGRILGVIGPVDVLSAADSLLAIQPEGTTATNAGRSPPSLSDQGVCESCGKLVDTLEEIDGTLVCEACADL